MGSLYTPSQHSFSHRRWLARRCRRPPAASKPLSPTTNEPRLRCPAGLRDRSETSCGLSKTSDAQSEILGAHPRKGGARAVAAAGRGCGLHGSDSPTNDAGTAAIRRRRRALGSGWAGSDAGRGQRISASRRLAPGLLGSGETLGLLYCLVDLILVTDPLLGSVPSLLGSLMNLVVVLVGSVPLLR